MIIARFPEPNAEEGWEAQKVADFELVQEVVRAIRNLRTEKRVPPSRKVPAILAAGDRVAMLDFSARADCFPGSIEPAGTGDRAGRH